MSQPHCPLCSSAEVAPYHEDRQRPYLQCETCRLVFVPPDYYLSATEEKGHYDLHQNDPRDAGYRNFLSRVFNPITVKVPPPAHGLDFGSGPGPTLSVMLSEAGYQMAIYDPLYAPDSSVLAQSYDFITCTEVAEHLHRPGAVFEQLATLLKPGGWLGVMTKQVISPEAFACWHYKNDPTHVCFFSRETFTFLASRLSLGVDFIADDVILLSKPDR